MKKILSLIFIAATIVIIFFIAKRAAKKSVKPMYSIGILQTASHPALDAVQKGFITTLKESLGNKIEFIIHNAQGSIPTMQTIAQRFHNDSSIDAIFAIATPAAQAIASVEKEKPIIIAAVTDPKGLGLITEKTNVAGASDMINIPGTIAMVQQLAPHAKKVGLLFNNGEANSVFLVSRMKQELAKHGIQTTEYSVNAETDVAQATKTASKNSDALLAPTDNTIASALPLIATIALEHKKPLFVSDNLLVQHGALAAQGIDYYENGVQAAQIAHKILAEGKNPFELPIAQQTNTKIYINKKTLTALGLTMPQSIGTTVVIVK